jgi:hypothetical protein
LVYINIVNPKNVYGVYCGYFYYSLVQSKIYFLNVSKTNVSYLICKNQITIFV